MAPPVITTRMVIVVVLTLLQIVHVQRGVPPESLGLLMGLHGYAASALSDRFTTMRLVMLVSLGVALVVALCDVNASDTAG